MVDNPQTGTQEETSQRRLSLSRLPVHLQILGGFLALQVVVLALSLSLIDKIRTRELENTIGSDLRAAASVFDSLLDRRRELLTFEMKLLGKDFAFKSALSTNDFGTIQSAAANLKERIGFSTFWVVNERGELLADVSDKRHNKKALGAMTVVSSALSQRPAAEVQILDGLPYYLVAVPIEAPQVIGAIVGGFEIGPDFAEELHRLTLSEVSFSVKDKIAVSTLDEAARRVLEDNREALSPSQAQIVGGAGRRQIILSKRMGPNITAYIQRSWEAAVEPLRKMKRSLLEIGLMGFVLTALLGYFIAEGVTAAILKLVGQLRSANENLTQLNGFQTKFFSMVTHDIRNPLNVLSIFADLISAEAEEPNLKEYAKRMLEAMWSLNYLISDLVDFAAIENGVLRMDMKEVDFAPMIEEFKERMALLAKGKEIRFDVSIRYPLPKIRGDARRIAQAMQNLVGNALNYTPRGGAVTLSVIQNNENVDIAVADTGIGIAPEDINKIYQRFFQADNAKKMSKDGFGLGLKIAREIINAHSGTLSVKSELGKGSTFTFTLPVQR